MARKPSAGLAEAFERSLAHALLAGTTEHYRDSVLYDHEYRGRRDDLRWYRALAAEVGGPILELGCGSGRLLAPLARDGHQVTGVDLSPTMLFGCRARIDRLPVAARKRAKVVEADFRTFALGRRFSLVIAPFNALMHLYTRDDVERCLRAVRRHLRPGGLFAFDVMHPDLKWLSRDSRKRWSRTRFRDPRSGAPCVYSHDLVYDSALQIAFMRIYYERADRPTARPKVVRLAHRYFFPLELEALLHYNGLSLERRDGDFDGSPLTPGSDLQVCRCRPRRQNFRPRREIIDNP